MVLSACSAKAPMATLHQAPPLPTPKPLATNNPDPDAPETLILDTTLEPQTSVFLADISSTDLELVTNEARTATLPNWDNIDTRAQKVRLRMLNAIQALNAPQELLFVPVAESGYNPYALSPAGAFGLWQLMPRTAMELGAVHRHGIDGRRHVENSTQAAVSYLLTLHEKFDSWPLALCAYNLGPWGVQRRLNKQPWHPDMGLDALPFPAETKHYVKQILGMIALQERGEITFSAPLATDAFQIEAPIDLNQLEQIAGMEKNEVFYLNPGFDYQHYLNRNIELHLPQKNIAVLQEALKNDPNILKPKHISVKIKQGDSLWKIAHHHHTNIAYLRQLNPNLSNTLSVGHRIIVPASNSFTATSYKYNPLLVQGRRIHYKVRNGDSLWKIAEKFGTSSHAIARTNQMSANALIRPGDRLWIIARLRPN